MTTASPVPQLGRIVLAYAKVVACADGATRDGWALPCGCLIHHFDGAPETIHLKRGKSVLIGVVAPHLHVSVGCSLH